jgi:ActR/RegA family two-component response regulator
MPGDAKPLRKLLLVEDDAAYRYLLANALRRADLTVLDAADTLQALTLFEADPDIRHMVVDLRILGVVPNGLSFARMARFRRRGTKVALISGVPELLSVVDDAEFGEVLAKSDDVAGLAGALHRVLGLDTDPPVVIPPQ